MKPLSEMSVDELREVVAMSVDFTSQLQAFDELGNEQCKMFMEAVPPNAEVSRDEL